jgi:hypothetical protein
MMRADSARKPLVLALAAAVVVGAGLHAQAPVRSSTLLTATEIDAAVGSKPADPAETNISYAKGQQGNDHAGVVSTAVWRAGGATVSVTSSTTPTTAEGKKRGQAQTKQAEEMLAKMGWKTESKDFGAIKCAILTPPSGQPMPGAGTSCGTERGAYFVSVSVSVPGTAFPIEKVRALTEKAASRLQ